MRNYSSSLHFFLQNVVKGNAHNKKQPVDFRSIRYFTVRPPKNDLILWDGMKPLSIQAFNSIRIKNTLNTSANKGVKLLSSVNRYPFTARQRTAEIRNYSTEFGVYKEEITPSYRLNVGFSGAPHPGKGKGLVNNNEFAVFGCGEDAFFVRPDAMAVADGVGGWAGVKDANPALYSKRLLENVYDSLEKMHDITCEEFLKYNDAVPEDIVMDAYKRTTGILGSCTVCLAILRKKELRIANIGDSGIFVYRNGNCILRSTEQQHDFNYPFQLGPKSEDTPLDAQIFKINLLPQDLIIMGTDGLFDNLYDYQIVDIIKENMKCLEFNPKKLSNHLLVEARKVAEDRGVFSPFASKASLEGLRYQGGKMDDISVVVGMVDVLEDSPDRR